MNILKFASQPELWLPGLAKTVHDIWPTVVITLIFLAFLEAKKSALLNRSYGMGVC